MAERRSEVDDLIIHERYEEAVHLAESLAEGRPEGSPEQEVYRLASVAYLLEQARVLTFNERDDDALVLIDRALEIAPHSEQARMWSDKTRLKLAETWLYRGQEYHANDNLDAALESYERSMGYTPLDMAVQGQARCLLQLNYRDGLSESYYNEGVRALRDYWLELARGRFSYSAKYRREGTRADRRIREVDGLLARERAAVALHLEEQELFAASFNEYRIALLIDPDLEDAKVGMARMRIEADAKVLFDAASMMVLRGEWERARTAIEEGLGQTQIQAQRFEDLLADIDDARLDELYEHALDLEHDFQYVEAIAAYKRLLEEREWFKDARSRANTLEEYVVHARDLYAQAASSAHRDERLAYLRQIDIFWPEYRDVQERLEELEAAED
jgi:tetratricopeptide (TPR) repeat protein